MNWIKLALVALLMITMFSLTACARRGYGYGAGFVVRTPPPPPMSRGFVGHAPGPGYVWTEGYWSWRNRWVWVAGAWVRPPRPHSVWTPGHWMRVRDGYAWREGRWRH